MQCLCKTDTGKIRRENQDSCACGIFSEDVAWAVVCDGMGGAAAGEVAAKTACNFVADRIKNSLRPDMTILSAKNLLITSITSANITVYDLSTENRSYRGMGTTIVASIVIQDVVITAYVGDSRAYLLHGNDLSCVSHDHSVVQEMVDAGKITPEEARCHPDKNLITRALGVDESIEIDFAQRDFTKNDILMLCSDGLTNGVSEDTIKKVITENTAEEIPERLIDAANAAGGWDNITAAVISR